MAEQNGEALPHSIVADSTRSTILNENLQDETFKALGEHFLKVGKGRRPALPALAAPTARLLAQLCLLRDIGNATWSEVTSWFLKLFPDVCGVTCARLQHKCQKAIQDARTLTEENLQCFLDGPVTFEEELPLALRQFNLTRSALLSCDPDDFNLEIENDAIVSNEVVSCLELFFNKEKIPLTVMCRWLIKLCKVDLNESQMRHKITLASKKLKKLRKGKKDVLDHFLKLSFLNDSANAQKSHSNSVDPIVRVPVLKADEKVGLLKNKIVTAEEEIKRLKSTVEILKEEKIKLNSELEVSKKNKRESELLIRNLKRDLKVMNDNNKDLVTCLEDLKETKTYKRNTILKKENSVLRNELFQLDNRNKKLKQSLIYQKLVKLKTQIKAEQTLKSKWKSKFQKLEIKYMQAEKELEMDRAKELDPLQLKEARFNKFSDKVRLTYMALQGEADVAASKCSKVVRIISQHLFNMNIKALPSVSSALNFADEGQHLAKQQVVEQMLDREMFTYASDGTSRQKRHYVERHIVLDNGLPLSLGFTEIASDDAKSLLEQAIEMLEELTNIHCSFDEEADANQILKEILRKMRNLMSDRAANMKAFNKQLAAYKVSMLGEDASTNYLFCNAHFLLGLANATETAVKIIEKRLTANGSSLGRDNDKAFYQFSASNETAALRVLRASADVFGPRGDEKSGTRRDWLEFCHDNDIKSTFSSYRANRFNNIFDNAEALIFHRPHVVQFLENSCGHMNLKLQSILKDLQDERIMSIISAIAIINKYFTGPYWALMNSTKPYGAFPKYVSLMDSALSTWIGSNTVEGLKSVFSDFVMEGGIDEGACLSFDSVLTHEAFVEIIQNFQVVLRRQLCDFLPGGIYGGVIDQELQEILDKCPLTNLIGERLFGDFDFDMIKRRHCTPYHHSTINMWKHNNTEQWIREKSSVERQKRMSAAHRNGSLLRKKHKDAGERESLKIREKLKEHERHKKAKDIRSKESKTDILNAIIAHGGVCTTKEEVDELYKNGKLEDLKMQLRYRKIFLNEKYIKLSGTKHDLYDNLIRCIEAQEDEEKSDDENMLI